MKLSIHLVLTILTLIGLTYAAGTVNLKVQGLDSSPSDLVWCGSQRDTVLVLTENFSVYRSDDKGFTWKKMNDILTHTGKNELEDNENEIGKVSRLIESPLDKNLIIFLGTHGINWVSEDCGRKIKAMNHGRKISEFIFHPTERNWVLASANTICEDFENEPCKIYKELFVTRDLGENWDILGEYIVQFGWGAFDQSHVDAGIPKERVLVSHEPKARGSQKQHGWSFKIELIYSDDFFKTKRVATHKGNKFLITKEWLFVAQVVDEGTQEVMLLAANATDKIYNFQNVVTSSKNYREHSYTFLDTSGSSVFLHVNHFGEKSKYGHIYISDASGTRYSASLKYNIRGSNNQCDFQKVESLEGSYIANIIEKDYMKQAEQEFEEEMLEDEGMGIHKPRRNEDNFRDYVYTVLSMNRGGQWRRLTAPSRKKEGGKYDCESNCYLNLHAISSDNIAPFYSVQSAAGLIVGNGNVGSYLSHNLDELSTFLSRDGGITWEEIKKGSHIYEIGDHGGLIVMADEMNPTNLIYYSWDEGKTFQEINLGTEKMTVKNIIIEPTSTSQHFVVYGESLKKGQKVGVVVGLDFSSLHEPMCRNPNEPNSENSDYETWTPSNFHASNGCLLGKKITYVRRKRDVECYNSETYERKSNKEFCECTEEDYECDAGYQRTEPGAACSPMTEESKKVLELGELHAPPQNCVSYYTITKGYRKIPGNECVNGVKFDPIVIACPNKFFNTLGMIFFILIIVALGFALIFYLSNKSLFSREENPYLPNIKLSGNYVDLVKYL